MNHKKKFFLLFMVSMVITSTFAQKTITFYAYHANWNPWSKEPFSAVGHVIVEFSDDGVWGLGLDGIEPEGYNLDRSSERKRLFIVTDQQYQEALVVLDAWKTNPNRYHLY